MKLKWQSFLCALNGLKFLWRTQVHARWHAVTSLAVIAAAVYYQVERWEWGMLLIAMALVWTTEAMNTAIEQLGDAVTKEKHPLVGLAKDIAAGAVVLAAVFAAGVGVLVFGPRVFISGS